MPSCCAVTCAAAVLSINACAADHGLSCNIINTSSTIVRIDLRCTICHQRSSLPSISVFSSTILHLMTTAKQLQQQLTPALQIMVCDAAPHLKYSNGWHRQQWFSSTRAAVCVTCIVIDNKPLRFCRIQSPDPIPAQFHTMLHTLTTIGMRLATMMMITFTMHNTNNHKIQTKHSGRTDLNPRRFCPKVGQIQRTLKLTMDLSAVSINNFKVLDT